MPSKEIRALMDRMEQGKAVPTDLLPTFKHRWALLRESLVTTIEKERDEPMLKQRQQ
jgi:hypothetical protein